MADDAADRGARKRKDKDISSPAIIDRAPAFGAMIHQAISPTATSFRNDLKVWARPSMPNSRPSPVMGLSLPKSGSSLAGAQIRPVCSTLPASPATAAAASTPTTGSPARRAWSATDCPPRPVRSKASGWAMKGRSSAEIARAMSPP